MDATTSLRANFTDVFDLPAPAVDFLVTLFDVIQTFDDYKDGDSVTESALDALIWNTLSGLLGNPFFAQHRLFLSPIITLSYLKWHASTTRERAGGADEKCYMWRAGYFDVVLMAVVCAHGREKAQKLAPFVMDLYGENFDNYLAEHINA